MFNSSGSATFHALLTGFVAIAVHWWTEQHHTFFHILFKFVVANVPFVMLRIYFMISKTKTPFQHIFFYLILLPREYNKEISTCLKSKHIESNHGWKKCSRVLNYIWLCSLHSVLLSLNTHKFTGCVSCLCETLQFIGLISWSILQWPMIKSYSFSVFYEI